MFAISAKSSFSESATSLFASICFTKPVSSMSYSSLYSGRGIWIYGFYASGRAKAPAFQGFCSSDRRACRAHGCFRLCMQWRCCLRQSIGLFSTGIQQRALPFASNIIFVVLTIFLWFQHWACIRFLDFFQILQYKPNILCPNLMYFHSVQKSTSAYFGNHACCRKAFI